MLRDLTFNAALQAIFLAGLYLLGMRIGSALKARISTTTEFSKRLRTEAGHSARRKLAALDARLTAGGGAALVATCSFAFAWLLQPSAISTIEVAWFKPVVTGCMLLLVLVFAVGMFKVWQQRARVRYEADARAAVGQGLVNVFDENSAVFHEVRLDSAGTQTIDHLIVGSQGIYAVQVVVERPRSRKNRGGVQLSGSALVFDDVEDPLGLGIRLAAPKALSRYLASKSGEPVLVRSVIAVPGWDIRAQTSEEHLLVNESMLTMIRGWTDTRAHLLDEQVSQICSEMHERSRLTR